jgi:GNAT superfamily N-acetyltransferase
VQIHPATLTDAARISELILHMQDLLTIEPNGVGAEEFLQSLRPEAIASYITSPNFNYLIGTNDDKLVGLVAVRDNQHLYHLFVSSAEHGKGYGKQLWNAAKAQSIARGNIGEFTVNSSLNAIAVYQSFGFVAVAGKEEKHGIAYIPMCLFKPHQQTNHAAHESAT